MPKNKPSFFERLTGTLHAEQETKRSEAKRLVSLKKLTPELPPVGVIPGISKVLPLETGALKAEEGKDENWLPQSEGQLAIDVYQTPADIVIKSTIAGVSEKDLEVSITNDMVTIKGCRQDEESAKSDDYYYQECYWGPFSRSIILPTDVLTDQATAILKNGILTVRLPKVEKVRTKKIVVETA